MLATETARGLLIEQRVAQRIEAARRREADVDRGRRAIHAARRHRPWYERHARVRDAKRALDDARHDLAEAEKERDAALAACAAVCPLVEVVYQVEALIDRARRDSSIGRAAGSGDALARSLDRLRDRILDRWFPGVDLPALIARLVEDDSLGDAPPSLAPPSTDPQLGYAALDAEELYVRVAREAAVCRTMDESRQTLGIQKTMRARIAEQLAALEEEVSLVDELLPGENSEAERARNAQRRALGAQEKSQLAALERAQHAVAQAMARAHPIAWLALTAGGAAAAFRAVRTVHETTLRGGAAVQVASAAGRSVALAALVELRRACDAAFDGLGAEMFPRARAPKPTRPEAGPYRVNGFAPRVPEPVEKGRSEVARAFADELEKTSLRAELAWGVAVSTAAGILALARTRTAAEISWLDRAIFWSDTDDEQREAALAKRVRALSDIVAYHASLALRTVDRRAATHPLLRIGRAITATHASIDRITTLGGTSSTSRACPVFGLEPATEQLTFAVNGLSHHTGGIANRSLLVRRICERIEDADRTPIRPVEAPRTFDELVELFASLLRSTELVSLVRAYEMHEPLADAAHRRYQDAAAQVTLLDRINVFTDSPAEQARDRASQEASAHRHAAAQAHQRARVLLHGALAHHPPTALAITGVETGDLISQIRAHSQRRTRTRGTGSTRRTETYYVCVITGRTEAKASLDAWTRGVVDMLGPLPCAGDLLEDWVRAELD